MYTANRTLHQWIIITYPVIVASYKQFDEANPFILIGLKCTVPIADSNAISNQLTAVVTYKTRYLSINKESVTMSFGLGKVITVSTIIGLPKFKAWKIILNLNAN